MCGVDRNPNGRFISRFIRRNDLVLFGIHRKGILPVFIESNFRTIHSDLVYILVGDRYGFFATEGIDSAVFHTFFDPRRGLVYFKAHGAGIGNISGVVGQTHIDNIRLFGGKVYGLRILPEFRRILDRLFA